MPTDTERLNWIVENGGYVLESPCGWYVTHYASDGFKLLTGYRESPREAIDEVMGLDAPARLG